MQIQSDSFTLVTNPWRADLFTAYLTTQIPNIDTFSVFPPPLPFMMRHPKVCRGLLQGDGLIKLLQYLPAGPPDTAWATGKTYVLGQVQGLQGETQSLLLVGPEAYLFSALTT